MSIELVLDSHIYPQKEESIIEFVKHIIVWLSSEIKKVAFVLFLFFKKETFGGLDKMLWLKSLVICIIKLFINIVFVILHVFLLLFSLFSSHFNIKNQLPV